MQETLEGLQVGTDRVLRAVDWAAEGEGKEALSSQTLGPTEILESAETLGPTDTLASAEILRSERTRQGRGGAQLRGIQNALKDWMERFWTVTFHSEILPISPLHAGLQASTTTKELMRGCDPMHAEP